MLFSASRAVRRPPHRTRGFDSQGSERGWLKLLAGYDATGHGLGVKVLRAVPREPAGREPRVAASPIRRCERVPARRHGRGLHHRSADRCRGHARNRGVRAGCHECGARRNRRGGVVLVARDDTRACPRIESLKVFSRSEQRRTELAARCAGELGLQASPVPTVDEAVADVEIIVTATNSPEPVLFPHHLSPGVHLNAMGIRTEIAPETTAACVVIGDGREESIGDGKFSVAIAAGVVTADHLGPELGAVLDSGRPATVGKPTMFDSSGVTLQDVTSARYVWERAEQEDVGVLVDIVVGDVLS